MFRVNTDKNKTLKTKCDKTRDIFSALKLIHRNKNLIKSFAVCNSNTIVIINGHSLCESETGFTVHLEYFFNRHNVSGCSDIKSKIVLVSSSHDSLGRSLHGV